MQGDEDEKEEEDWWASERHLKRKERLRWRHLSNKQIKYTVKETSKIVFPGWGCEAPHHLGNQPLAKAGDCGKVLDEMDGGLETVRSCAVLKTQTVNTILASVCVLPMLGTWCVSLRTCVFWSSSLTGRVDAFYLLLASKTVDLSAVTLHLTQPDSPSLFYYLFLSLCSSSPLTPLFISPSLHLLLSCSLITTTKCSFLHHQLTRNARNEAAGSESPETEGQNLKVFVLSTSKRCCMS